MFYVQYNRILKCALLQKSAAHVITVAPRPEDSRFMCVDAGICSAVCANMPVSAPPATGHSAEVR